MASRDRVATRQGLRSRVQVVSDDSPLGKPIKKEASNYVNLDIKPFNTKNEPLIKESSPESDDKKIKPEQIDDGGNLKRKRSAAQQPNGSASLFPTFNRPTPMECELAHEKLVTLHGERNRPQKVVAPTDVAGCGSSASVLDALVRTILSQNTSSKNSTRAMHGMEVVYGGSDQWESIAEGGQGKLQEAIRSGGLSVVKSKAIMNLLATVYQKYGKYSLDHLFEASNDDAMQEMLSFPGVGPKTASCVLLFCLQRPSFAVDTHIYRLTGFLGWRPKNATREQAQVHLDERIPDQLKYSLHVLLIEHGRTCPKCRGGSTNSSSSTTKCKFMDGASVKKTNETNNTEPIKQSNQTKKQKHVKKSIKHEI